MKLNWNYAGYEIRFDGASRQFIVPELSERLHYDSYQAACDAINKMNLRKAQIEQENKDR